MQALGLVWENVAHPARGFREIRSRIPSPTQYGARLLLSRWLERDAGDGFAIGRDLPSRALSTILRNLALLEPCDNDVHYRVRLAGAAFMRRYDRDIGGLLLSDFVAPSEIEVRAADLDEVILRGEPLIELVRVVRGEKTYLAFESLHLRVHAPDRCTSWVLAGMFHKDDA